MKFYSRWS